MSTVEQLPALLDTAAAAPLAERLQAQLDHGAPLLLDGAAVGMVGQACLQVLLSARMSAAARNLGFVIQAPSDAMTNMMTIVGATDLLKTVEA